LQLRSHPGSSYSILALQLDDRHCAIVSRVPRANTEATSGNSRKKNNSFGDRRADSRAAHCNHNVSSPRVLHQGRPDPKRHIPRHTPSEPGRGERRRPEDRQHAAALRLLQRRAPRFGGTPASSQPLGRSDGGPRRLPAVGRGAQLRRGRGRHRPSISGEPRCRLYESRRPHAPPLRRVPRLRRARHQGPRPPLPGRVRLCGNQILRRVRPESPRRPPRHRRETCSMAWRCGSLTARRSQHDRTRHTG
jgi:hypothetical protein